MEGPPRAGSLQRQHAANQTVTELCWSGGAWTPRRWLLAQVSAGFQCHLHWEMVTDGQSLSAGKAEGWLCLPRSGLLAASSWGTKVLLQPQMQTRPQMLLCSGAQVAAGPLLDACAYSQRLCGLD